MSTILGIFFILHGLVHMWYFALARRIVPFKEEMGWSGKSWLFTRLVGDQAARLVESLLLGIVTLMFVVGGIAFLAGAGWGRIGVVASAAVSFLVLGLSWDGSAKLIVQKGLIGVSIDAAILAGLLVF
jgi:hypothetical protein